MPSPCHPASKPDQLYGELMSSRLQQVTTVTYQNTFFCGPAAFQGFMNTNQISLVSSIPNATSVLLCMVAKSTRVLLVIGPLTDLGKVNRKTVAKKACLQTKTPCQVHWKRVMLDQPHLKSSDSAAITCFQRQDFRCASG